MELSFTLPDSEPEREAARASSYRAQLSFAPIASSSRVVASELDSDLEMPSPAQPPRAAPASSKSNAPKVRSSKPKSAFSSASAVMKEQARLSAARQKSKAVSAPPAASIDVDESDGNLPSASNLVQTMRSKSVTMTELTPVTYQPADADEQQSGAESADEEPQDAFARTMGARFMYKPGATSLKSAPANYFSTKAGPSRSASNSDSDLPAITTTSTTDKGKAKAKATPALSSVPIEMIALLSTCPVCSEIWTGRKTAPTKSKHIHKCARDHSWDDARLLASVESTIRALKDAEVQKHKQVEAERTLFQGVVGIGRSTMVDKALHKADAEVIGVDDDAYAATQGGTLATSPTTSTQVQKDLEAKKKLAKKTAPPVSAKLAKAVKLLDQPNAASSSSSSSKNLGNLRTYEQNMDRIGERAKEMVDGFGDSRLTQVPARPAPIELHETDDSFTAPPPSTQPMKPSKLAAKFAPSTNKSKLAATRVTSSSKGSMWDLANGIEEVSPPRRDSPVRNNPFIRARLQPTDRRLGTFFFYSIT